jgi:uncharacterized protein (TIGR03083 family)
MTEPGSGRDLAVIVRSATQGTGRFSAVLRGLSRSTADSAQVGEWTLSQTVAHVIGTVRLYRRMLTGWASPVDIQAGGLATLNAGIFAGLVEDRPEVLADLLEEAVDAYVAEALEAGPDTVCRFHGGLPIDVVTLTAFLGNEILMHGWDVAHAVAMEFTDDQAALAVLDILIPLLAALVDPDALKLGGRVAITLDDGVSHGYVLDPDGAAYIAGGPGIDFDCVVQGPAFDLLLWRGGRREWPGTGLRASGPRPELAASFVIPF